MNLLPVYLRKVIKFVWSNSPYLKNIALAPRRLSVEITDRCNLNCYMCPRNFSKVENRDLSLERFQYILDRLPGIEYICLLGRGEAFLHPDIFGMLAAGNKRKVYFTIVTNGTLLNDEIIDRLPANLQIVVSLDSPYPDKMRRIRGVDLVRIINNLKKLKARRKEIHLSLQPLILEDNIEDLPAFIDLVRNINADDIAILSAIAFEKKLDIIKNGNYGKIINKLKETKALANKYGISLLAAPIDLKPRPCLEPWSTLRIGLNGDIYPCCYIYESSYEYWSEWYGGLCVDVPQVQYKMGNIFVDSLNKIWNSRAYRQLREIVKETNKQKLFDDEALNKVRESMVLNERFSYCKVCLYRQNRAC